MHEPHGAPPDPQPRTQAFPHPADIPPHPPLSPHPQHLTYPWQPLNPPVPPRPRRPAGPALGHHSDIRILRKAYKWLRRVATCTALGYFTLFLVLSAYAPQLMTLRVDGGLSAGLLLGLCQLPVTFAAIAVYERHARRRVDPLSERLRRQAELEARR
ncbi:DUF485 domain-containing protein [Streptomyces monticola]|uniref:DUF485 domain-containing protein n=1 Tax=Streptomyces monticola TaxID=2666263 RepID=A0ABW2JKM2_9ACTN